VHVAHQHAEGGIKFQIFDVGVGVLSHGAVIKHQDDTSHREHQEKKKRDSPHAPGEADAQRVTPYFGGMQVEPNIVGHLENTVSRGVGVSMPEHGFPYVGVEQFLAKFVQTG
jgi:hypothetical protein